MRLRLDLHGLIWVVIGTVSLGACAAKHQYDDDDSGNAGAGGSGGATGARGGTSGRGGGAPAGGTAGTSSSSGGSGTGPVASCLELQSCCAELSGDLAAACSEAVTINTDQACFEAFVTLTSAGYCSDTGAGGTASGGSGGSSGTETGGTSGTGTGGSGAGGTSSGGTGTGGSDAGGTSSSGTGGAGGTTAGPGCTNIALGAVATAQSTYPGYSAANVVDGDRDTTLTEDTSWANDWQVPDLTFPQWFDIDWGTEATVSRIELYTSATAEIGSYDILWFDGQDYQPLLSITGNTDVHRTHEFDPIVTSAIRFNVQRGPESQFNFTRLNEVEVYGALGAECP